jgi:hypothetical protein
LKSLSGSLLVVAGAIMIGSGQLAQALALSAGWLDTPVSMRVIGGVFLFVGFLLLAFGIRRDTGRIKSLSGAILVIAAAIVFGLGKIALIIASSAGHREKPVGMLVLGSALSIGGLVMFVCGIVSDREVGGAGGAA